MLIRAQILKVLMWLYPGLHVYISAVSMFSCICGSFPEFCPVKATTLKFIHTHTHTHTHTSFLSSSETQLLAKFQLIILLHLLKLDSIKLHPH